MKVEYSTLINNTNSYEDISVDEVNTCPRCKVSIKPVHLSSIFLYDENESDEYYDTASNWHNDFKIDAVMHSHLLCNFCSHSFIAEYDAKLECCNDEFFYLVKTPASVHPRTFVEKEYNESIKKLSPSFVNIYNQAMAAETANLDEIAGLGYRKSLEFLVKDFSIYMNPDSKNSIISAPLGQCIKTYIDNDRIKTLAERSTWIGNDEAHYIRKHEDRSCEDMKSFIQAIVYFISMILITEDASSMSPK